MNSTDLYKAFSKVDEDILERSEKAAERKVIPLKRRVVMAVAAVLVVVVLMGAAAVKYYDSIQGWLAHYWEQATGEKMSDEQQNVIEHLSQNIGISQTVNGITIIVDSATVGEKSFELLLRAEGMENHEDFQPNFRYMDIQVDGYEKVSKSYSERRLNDGSLLMLFDVKFGNGDVESTEPLEVTLNICDTETKLVGYEGFREIEITGEWKFYFTLEHKPLETIKLPDTEVVAWLRTDEGEIEELPVVITNVELSNIGLSFEYKFKYEKVYTDVSFLVDRHYVYAVLENGLEIDCFGGSANTTFREDAAYATLYLTWPAPIDIDEVVAIHIGDTVIPVK